MLGVAGSRKNILRFTHPTPFLPRVLSSISQATLLRRLHLLPSSNSSNGVQWTAAKRSLHGQFDDSHADIDKVGSTSSSCERASTRLGIGIGIGIGTSASPPHYTRSTSTTPQPPSLLPSSSANTLRCQSATQSSHHLLPRYAT